MLKPACGFVVHFDCLITVQDNTMLKQNELQLRSRASLITVQDNTMLKPQCRFNALSACLITVQDNTMLKPIEKLLDL